MDLNGVAVVIGAVVAGVVSIGTFSMQVISYIDQRKLKKAQDELKIASENRDIQLSQVKSLVNGQTEKLIIKATKEAYEQGRQHERETPSAPSPSYPVSRIDEILGIRNALGGDVRPSVAAAILSAIGPAPTRVDQEAAGMVPLATPPHPTPAAPDQASGATVKTPEA